MYGIKEYADPGDFGIERAIREYARKEDCIVHAIREYARKEDCIKDYAMKKDCPW